MILAENEASKRIGFYDEQEIDFENILDCCWHTPILDEELTGYWGYETKMYQLETDEEKETYKTKAREKMRSIATYLLKEIPMNSQVEDIRNALDSLVKDYISLDLDFKYDLIDSDMFELQRILPLDHRPNAKVTIPTFASVKFGESIWEYDALVEKSSYSDKIHVSSRAPPIIKKAKERAKEFTKDYFESITKTLDDDIFGDLLLRSRQDIEAPLDFRMYWIPLPSELEITIETIEKDPLLVSHNLGRNFLVAQWEADAEQPFQNYLNEFSCKRFHDMGLAFRHPEFDLKNYD